MNSIWLAFLTGLTTGGLSCLAVQGGLLASSVAPISDPGNQDKKSIRIGSVGMFLASKLVAYTILGFFLGFLGSSLTLTPKLLGMTQIFAGLFMLATAARIANIHPVFRYFVIQPPRWAYRMLKQTSTGGSWFAPAMLGFLTVLIPCGVTQATMAIAIASASPWFGAAIMGVFVIGTSPVFFVLGATVTQLLKQKMFAYATSGIVMIFAILSINGGLGLMGSFYTFQNIWRAATITNDELVMVSRGGQVAGISSGGTQEVTITAERYGYEQSATTLKAGIPVRLSLVTNNTRGCTRAFTIPDYGISRVLPETGREVVEFTPVKSGRLAYSCGMGMFTGSFNVIL